MVFSLGVIVLVTTLGTSFLVRSLSEDRMQSRSLTRHEAFYLAEAAIDRALINLRTPLDASDDVYSATMGTGSYQVDTPVVALGANRWMVTTRGMSDQELRRMEAVFELSPQSVFQYAVFGSNGVSVSGNATTDSFDSTLGSYGSQDPGHNGDVGTNSTNNGGISVSGSIFVDGQLVVGPDISDPEALVTGFDPAFVTGGTSPPTDTQDVMSAPITFPMPSDPTEPPVGCSAALPPIVDHMRVFDAGVDYCPSGTVTINGGDIWTATGAVNIYLEDELQISGNATVGVEDDPTMMRFLMSAGSEATMEGSVTGSSVFYGVIYGPNATINISGNAEIYGSVIARQVNVTGSATIHYDEATQNITDISNVYRTAIISWRELN